METPLPRSDLFHLEPARPVTGDVVINSCENCPTDYVLGLMDSPAQIRYDAYARALDVARRWAKHAHIDVWFADRGCEFVLISRHRADEPRQNRDGCRDHADCFAGTVRQPMW